MGSKTLQRKRNNETWDRYEILPNWKSEITFEDGVTMI